MTEMTSGIGDLLQRLRKDGVDAGEHEKQRILREATAQASALIADAEARAEQIIADAETMVADKRAQLDAELSLAARDFAFRFAERVRQQTIDPLVKRRSIEALDSGEVLKDLLTALAREKSGNARVTVSPDTRAKLESYFQGELGQLLEASSLEILTEDGLAGFRLQREGESFTWDVTGETMAAELSALVAPTLRKYLQLPRAER